MVKRTRSARNIGSRRHAIFFFAVYVVGALILTFEKTIVYAFFEPSSSVPKAIVIVTALILMGGYVIFVTLVPATKLRTDVAADNVYYLGFLYTLTSLAIALSVDSPDAILANFGVAIVSTLIGIAARVGLNQLRIDPTDIEEASRLELAEATRRVKLEMTETVLQFSDFRRLSLQVLAEGYSDVQKNVEEISGKVLKSVEELVEQSARPLLELAENTKATHIEAANSVSSLTESNRELTKSNQRAIEKIEEVSSALVKLTRNYADTGIIDDKIVASVREQLVIVQAELAEARREGIDELKEALGQFNDRASADRQTSTKNDVQSPVGNAESIAGDVTEEKDTKDNVALSSTQFSSRRPYVQTFMHMGVAIVYHGQGWGYTVNDEEYMTLADAKSAIERKLNFVVDGS
ncbi:MAG: hypothetical protein ACMUJK_11550 [Rhodobacterales bacterium]